MHPRNRLLSGKIHPLYNAQLTPTDRLNRISAKLNNLNCFTSNIILLTKVAIKLLQVRNRHQVDYLSVKSGLVEARFPLQINTKQKLNMFITGFQGLVHNFVEIKLFAFTHLVFPRHNFVQFIMSRQSKYICSKRFVIFSFCCYVCQKNTFTCI